MPCLPMLYDYCYARVDAYPRLEPEISRSLNLPLGFLALNSPGSHNYDIHAAANQTNKRGLQATVVSAINGNSSRPVIGGNANIVRTRNSTNAFSLSAIRQLIAHSDNSVVRRSSYLSECDSPDPVNLFERARCTRQRPMVRFYLRCWCNPRVTLHKASKKHARRNL